MKTNYYCKKCDMYFFEEGLPPNLNRIHYECGEAAAIVNHEADSGDDKEPGE